MLNQYHDIHIVNVDKLTYAGCLSNLNDIQNNLRYTFFQLDICSQVKIEKILHFVVLPRWHNRLKSIADKKLHHKK